MNFFAVATLAILAATIAANHRYQRSLVPLTFLLLAVLAKLVGLWVTFGGLVAGGPDFGIMLLLIEVWAVCLWQFVTVGEMTRGA